MTHTWLCNSELCSYLVQYFNHILRKNQVWLSINSVNLFFCCKIIGYFTSYSMGAFLSLPLHLIIFCSFFCKFRSHSHCLWLTIFVTSCCINTHHKCSAFVYSSVVRYICTTFSSWFKLFFKLLISLRTNAVIFSKCLYLLNLSIFKNCKSILLLHLEGHNSLMHFFSGPTSKIEMILQHNQQSNYSDWNFVHQNLGLQNQESNLLNSEVKRLLDKMSAKKFKNF